eukprot:COSAG01_NODE_6115_length_3843_cov_1.972489_4_plen_51_part_00
MLADPTNVVFERPAAYTGATVEAILEMQSAKEAAAAAAAAPGLGQVKAEL